MCLEISMKLLEVMDPVLSSEIRAGNEWIHQIKWDGIRGISYIEDGRVRIYTKSGRERTSFYPEIQIAPKLLNGHQAVLDGELVVFNTENRPSFHLIMNRERLRNSSNLPVYQQKYPVCYILFDLLFLNGTDLRSRPLEERQDLLRAKVSSSSDITVTDDFTDGSALFKLMKERNYEGIVSKRKNSRYQAGKKHNDWFKTKISKKILAIVGGLSWKEQFPNSLLLGIFQGGQYLYIGNASLGLSQKDFQLLKAYASDYTQESSPFDNLKKMKDTTWLKPVLTCWVSFLEWTDSRSLRHPKILGFSKDPASEAQGKETIME